MLDWIVAVQPTSILDIGVGHGKWGFLAREYTDIFVNRYRPEEWKVRIDGVEAFPTYANPIYDYAYNKVYFGDVMELLPTLPDYDLVIIGDVIEHFTKDQGKSLLRQLAKKSAYILLSSPTAFFQQEVLANPFETHRSLWNFTDFKEFEFAYSEVQGALFVALVRGERPSPVTLSLDGRAASLAYSFRWLRHRPKAAHMMKKYLGRLPGYRPYLCTGKA